ncbi:hypothetical protein CAPTEDRAFT_207080 [Capitella teleta]|uniref:Nucleotide-diphospho-sugar transferase domain-containing protein n=1 Tax=Capitella teleta TaxID=283909 RepID=R7VFM0_CAPTE|nr:hypothetical protein CAPTEDRAFT_207080 [Capitella teleta]|eukprot:ELU17414.1 hypothetical protein CAPTEDRAFT_207080 [Capitella teleta]
MLVVDEFLSVTPLASQHKNYEANIADLTLYVKQELSNALSNISALTNTQHKVATTPVPNPKPNYLQYTWHNGQKVLIGKEFRIPGELLDALGLPFKGPFVKLDEKNAEDFVFVTIASENHFDESIDAVALAQKLFPEHHIYFYDLGLTSPQVNLVKSWCRVTLVKFNYSMYPSHVRYLTNYAFKALAALDALKKANAIMWMDASFRLQTSNLTLIYNMAIQNGGVAQFFRSPHSIFAATDPKMFEYLVTDIEATKNTTMFGANSMLLYKTEIVYTRILHWWFLCALDQECIAPLWSSNICLPSADMRTVRVGQCHRQDQSAINILIANLNDFDPTRYVPEDRKKFVRLCKTGKVRLYNGTVC